MIHWLVQTTAAHPDLARGLPPAGLLSETEQARFAALRTAKRRQDWLLGRWTAKELLQQIVRQQDGATFPFTAFEIVAGDDGAPVATWHRPQRDARWSISLSHSENVAFCAAVERAQWPLGADIERVAPRTAAFAADYFTAAEQALAAQTEGGARDLLVTAVWSAKESALKAIHQGLKVDTRCVSCLIEPVAEAPTTWTAFAVAWERERLATAVPQLCGWWRGWGHFVLTITAAEVLDRENG